MSGDDTFLGRWSRRKQEAARPDQAPQPIAAEAANATRQDSTEQSLVEDGAPTLDEAALAERIAALPSIDDIGELTDVTPFMQSWVPGALRTQALRKLWTVDRAVREHVIFADYALDYNAPGGAPGYGAFESSIEMAKRALDSFSRDPAAPEPVASQEEQCADVAAATPPPVDSSEDPVPSGGERLVGPETQSDRPLVQDSIDPPDESASPQREPASSPVAMREEPVPSSPFSARRRHGSAAPR